MPIPKLDRMDRRILEEVQSDGSISNLELAERVGLSPSPCARRVKLLQESGIISRQITLLDQKKLGLPISIYISVSLDHQSPDRLKNFDNKITGWPEVVECSLITGSDTDYLLKVVMPDMDYYQKFLLDKLNQIEGVNSIRTSFVLRQVVQRTEMPLTHIWLCWRCLQSHPERREGSHDASVPNYIKTLSTNPRLSRFLIGRLVTLRKLNNLLALESRLSITGLSFVTVRIFARAIFNFYRSAVQT